MGYNSSALIQEPLPEDYATLSDEALDTRIARAKKTLGSDLVILGHHYQRDEVFKFADQRGDSLKLSRWAAAQDRARYIIFCGVHFMAETADILTPPDRAVILPDLGAGCSMADMAPDDELEDAWPEIANRFGGDVIPVAYINSSAAVKAFIGRHGGAICTSSNAAAVSRWAMGQARAVLFLPDEHLGRNTGVRLGLPFSAMAVWHRSRGLLRDPHDEPGPVDPEKTRMILWSGYCSVHGRFTTQQIDWARENFPGVNVIVHPECRYEVVRAADDSGSTEHIISRVAASPAGSTWAVGTEINLVNRLAREHPDKTVFCLDEIVCPCATMYRISPQHLLWSLENLLEGRVVNRVQVPAGQAALARLALNRMLTIA